MGTFLDNLLLIIVYIGSFIFLLCGLILAIGVGILLTPFILLGIIVMYISDKIEKN